MKHENLKAMQTNGADLIEKNSMAWVSIFAGLWFIVQARQVPFRNSDGSIDSSSADIADTHIDTIIEFESVGPAKIGFPNFG